MTTQRHMTWCCVALDVVAETVADLYRNSEEKRREMTDWVVNTLRSNIERYATGQTVMEQ
jgi:hypothetical protein